MAHLDFGRDSFSSMAAFSPDGAHVAIGGSGRVAVWDWASGLPPTVSPEQGSIGPRAFSPDGARVVIYGGEAVKAWQWTTGTVSTLVHPGATVRTAELSPDGTRVVSAADDGTAKVWDPAGGSDPVVLHHGDPVNDASLAHRLYGGRILSAAFSADGTHVVTGTENGMVRVWEWAAGEPTILRNGRDVRSALFSPDGARVVSADGETVKVWEWASKAEPTVLRPEGGAGRAAFSPDGTRVVSVGAGAARVWDWAKGTELAVLRHGDGKR